MSRGGTKKARAEQATRRRTRKRRAQAPASSREKPKRVKQPRQAGKGRAAILHLSGLAGPLVLSLGLLAAGEKSTGNSSGVYWLSGLVDSPNASYVEEPAGLLYVGAVFVFAAAIFLLLPVALWRFLYRSHNVILRDRTSVDISFTMMVAIGIMWLYRIIAGFTDPLSTVALAMFTLSVYVPVFSAVLALPMPVIPGSGRIGGILPVWLRIPFTERFLLDDEQRETLRLFAEAKEQSDRLENTD